MMLLVLTSVLGFELKTAVGTSVFIMTFTAFTGAVSHFAIGGAPGRVVPCVLRGVYTFVGTGGGKVCQQGKPYRAEPRHGCGSYGAGGRYSGGELSVKTQRPG